LIPLPNGQVETWKSTLSVWQHKREGEQENGKGKNKYLILYQELVTYAKKYITLRSNKSYLLLLALDFKRLGQNLQISTLLLQLMLPENGGSTGSESDAFLFIFNHV